jgi:hypothetical protein
VEVIVNVSEAVSVPVQVKVVEGETVGVAEAADAVFVGVLKTAVRVAVFVAAGPGPAGVFLPQPAKNAASVKTNNANMNTIFVLAI